LPDLEHAPLNVSGIFSNQCFPKLQDPWFEVGLVLLGFSITRKALICDNPDNGIFANQCAL
jgi:hypothetical protein